MPTNSDYQILDGTDDADTSVAAVMEGLNGGRLAEKDAGGAESVDSHNVDRL